MSKENMKQSSECYWEHIDSLKAVARKSEQERMDFAQLQHNAAVQESTLQHYVSNLKHVQEMQRREMEQWQERARQLANQQKQLEMAIEQQSKNVALSKAELEHGLRMLDLFPNSSPRDYLADTSLFKSLNEAISEDWNHVGSHLANSYWRAIKP